MHNINSLHTDYMQKLNKVKKTIDKEQELKIIKWEYIITDLKTWQIIDIEVKNSKYKFNLSNNKQFMKKWTDRKLSIAIKKDLSLLEKEILFDILDYFDEENIIDFRKLALDYNYSPSKISKSRKKLQEKWLIKDKNSIYYLSPLVWIKTTEINQELIELFKDTFNKYWVDINFK